MTTPSSAIDLPTSIRIINPLEAPSQADLMLAETQLQTSRLQLIDFLTRANLRGYLLTGQQLGGFLGDSLSLQPTGSPSNQIVIGAGLGLLQNPSPQQNVSGLVGGNPVPVPGLDDTYPWSPVSLSTPITVNVPAADPTNPRIDLIEVKVSRTVTDQSQVLFLTNPQVGQGVPVPATKTLTWDVGAAGGVGNSAGAPIVYKTGTPGGSPVAPSIDVGYVALGYVRVAAAATSFDWDSLIDARNLLFPNGMASVSLLADVPSGSTQDVQLVGITAPPGVRVMATQSASGGSGLFGLYIQAGGLWNSIVAAASVQCFAQPQNGGGPPTVASTGVATVDGALQTKLLANGYKVALGQKLIGISITPDSLAASIALQLQFGT